MKDPSLIVNIEHVCRTMRSLQLKSNICNSVLQFNQICKSKTHSCWSQKLEEQSFEQDSSAVENSRVFPFTKA